MDVAFAQKLAKTGESKIFYKSQGVGKKGECLLSWLFWVQSLYSYTLTISLTLSWRRPISYRNQSIDLQSKSMNRFLYDIGLRHERVNLNCKKV